MKTITALLATGLLLVTSLVAAAEPKPPIIEIYDIGQTVVKLSLQEGVSPEDAVEAMLSRAAEVNMRQVGRLQVSKELKSRGVESRHLEIFQFCNPEDAAKMVAFNPIYAAYMPCRIALVEDENNQFWLLTLNLDILINKVALPDDLRRIATSVNGAILEIMSSASTGEF
ncbi:MAG: DUF302 domain-containing protein [Gammaproteobacteria bacterium]|nr:DUF302 domain-containing protein [Gammaproteobacteria bacterium]MDQ7074413.1 DUF302 domain-containing protein [Gammaproteobacteria bacterium]